MENKGTQRILRWFSNLWYYHKWHILVGALVLLVLIVVGMFQVQTARERNAEMAQYVQTLKTENRMLQTTYDNGYDLKQVEETALALGMVPADTVPVVMMTVNVPEQTEEYTVWGDFLWCLSCLFRA